MGFVYVSYFFHGCGLMIMIPQMIDWVRCFYDNGNPNVMTSLIYMTTYKTTIIEGG